jgi:hypothetical protein
MKYSIATSLCLGAAVVAVQNTSSIANDCNKGFFPGTDTTIFTVPYTYAQVLSIIGDYKNISWSGSPYDTVTLNGTDNAVGTARFYSLDGASVVETITTYSKPVNGPYEEIHVLNTITIPSLNLSAYADYDGTTVVPVCNGAASTFNFTVNFCATNPSVAAAAFHSLHLTDAETVGVFLGGGNFSSCAALANGATNASTSEPTYDTTNSASVTVLSIPTFIMIWGFWVLWELKDAGSR